MMRACRTLPLRYAAVACPLLLAVAMSLACPADVSASVSVQESLQIQGKRRTFSLYSPDAAGDAGRLPILVVLHGGLGNGRYAARQTGFANYVDRNKLIAVFPDGIGGHWNDGRRTIESGADDVAFLRNLIETVAQKWNGDSGRVFIAGVSNGGMMAMRMACEASNVVTAIGVVVANMPVDLIDRCHPPHPTPIVLFNGTADPIVPWSGGFVATSALLDTPGGEVLSAMKTFDLWSRLDGCGKAAVESLPGTRVKRHTSTGCRRPGFQVTLYEIEGGGHGWPGGPQPGPIQSRFVGLVTNDIDASAVMMRFFHHYGL
jgi:polyhydroxybutyrate depolymerase